MKGQTKTIPFRKTTACPSSTTLLSLRTGKLSVETRTLVICHLDDCDFCNAELTLLAHHRRMKTDDKVPEIPMNLRILAESILNRS
jgi:hypothetical protein